MSHFANAVGAWTFHFDDQLVYRNLLGRRVTLVPCERHVSLEDKPYSRADAHLTPGDGHDYSQNPGKLAHMIELRNCDSR